MKLALAIIAKDEHKDIKRIIDNYGQYFDEVAIAIDNDEAKSIVEKECKHPNLRLMKYEWIDDFSDKRNKLAEFIECDYYFRMDTDDEIDNPDKVREVFKKMVDTGAEVIYTPYVYSKDEDGNINCLHDRETFIKKSDNFYWKKPVHENIFVENQEIFKGAKDKSVSIIHRITEEHADQSFDRNWRILMKEYESDKENTDPRTLAYMGRMLAGRGMWKESIHFLEILVRKSGWEDDKYFAWVEMSQAYVALNDYETAIACCNEAMALNVEFPDVYVCLCEIYLAKQEYKKAIHWGMIGASKPIPETMQCIDPSRYTFRISAHLAFCYLWDGDYETAYKLFSSVRRIAPSSDFVKLNEGLFSEAYNNGNYFKNFIEVMNFTKVKDPSKMENLVNSIPKQLLKDERIQAIRNKYLPGKKWADNEIAIYCGNCWEDWGPPSIISGIGGSEEAIIYLSKELTKLGYKVTVFTSCGDFKGNYEGVEYKEFFEFNQKDDFNIVISWRGNAFNRYDVKAKKKIIWLHDVVMPDQFKGDEHKTFDKIMVLSEFHKSLLPKDIPEEKIYISTNGINVPDFMTNGVLRNSKRVIYTSSYDRGLEHLLRMWGDVRKEVPDAELHIFYGWGLYDQMAKAGTRDMRFKQMMVQLMKQDGVFEHGRIGHKKLVKEFQKSGIWAYPSHFEEISCISAMKAQSCGCVPVVTDYAALRETVKEGVKIDGKAGNEEVDAKFRDSLIDLLKDENKQNEIRDRVKLHREEFGWDKVAKRWSEELFV